MVRPRLCRRIFLEPNVTYFKPRGIPLRDLQESILSVDEFEAIRLKDLEGLEQEECAKKMIPDSYDLCPCASGKKYKFCCKKIFVEIMECLIYIENYSTVLCY